MKKSQADSFWLDRLSEGLLLLTIAVSLFLMLALMTYHRADPGFSHDVNLSQVANAAGRVGAWLSDFFLSMCGYLAYTFPLMLTYLVCLWFRMYRQGDSFLDSPFAIIALRLLGFLLILMGGSGLAGMYIRPAHFYLPFHAGGILGHVVSHAMQSAFNETGATLLLSFCLLIGITLFSGLSWLELAEWLGARIFEFCRWLLECCKRIRFRAKLPTIKLKLPSFKSSQPKVIEVAPTVSKPSVAIKVTPVEPKLAIATPSNKRAAEPAPVIKTPRENHAIIPNLALLDSPPARTQAGMNQAELELRSREVETRLADFGVEVKVVAVCPGPVVTRFELELAAGTKVSKISGLAKDLARSLSVMSVRVVEVIPGKSVIGIELPNENREMVSLQEVLASSAFQEARSALSLALGKDIAGHSVVVDLAKMPHLLVAGTTGSGKSVCLNAILMSLLYKSSPKQLRLILIDPKMLELAVYDDIPHLLAPVVTDMKDASSALRWCVVEMERRYRLMASLGVRNIAGFNQKIRQAQEKGKPLLDPLAPKLADAQPGVLEELAQIVVLADEFADMMVVVGKKVETLIARLAQKARAAGIHLILATQRPSVDVITGLIKANIPSRIAFQVSSKIDSRTILDQQGAEQLLGYGDMLYLAPGTGVPMRVHGAYVDDDEVHRVVRYLKESAEPDYLDAVLDDSIGVDASGYTTAAMNEDDAEQDPMYDEAVEFVVSAGRVSVSSIQRRFKIGYNRAARIVEAMEVAGVVSKMEGNGNREVLVPAREG